MVPTLFLYQLGRMARVWFCLRLSWRRPNDLAARRQPRALSQPPRRHRSSGPKPFGGLTPKPPGMVGAPEAVETAPVPRDACSEAPAPPAAASRGPRHALWSPHGL